MLYHDVYRIRIYIKLYWSYHQALNVFCLNFSCFNFAKICNGNAACYIWTTEVNVVALVWLQSEGENFSEDTQMMWSELNYTMHVHMMLACVHWVYDGRWGNKETPARVGTIVLVTTGTTGSSTTLLVRFRQDLGFQPITWQLFVNFEPSVALFFFAH